MNNEDLTEFPEEWDLKKRISYILDQAIDAYADSEYDSYYPSVEDEYVPAIMQQIEISRNSGL